MTDTEVKMIKAELSQMAAKDKFSNICESALRLINLYEAIILGNQMEIEELKKNALVWHKVAHGDYPPSERGNYSINVLTDCGDIAYYNYEDECWVVEPSSAEIDPPVAWCEIPKYEGKKMKDEIKMKKEEWHYLKENPNDLPKECEEVLAVYSNTYGAKGLLTDKNHLRYKLVQYYFEEEIGEWLWVESGTDDDIHEVIAWCELPKFEN